LNSALSKSTGVDISNDTELESKWSQTLDLNYESGSSTSPAQSGAASAQTIETKDVAFGADWTSPAYFTLGGGLQYSVETTDKLYGWQPSLTLGKKFKFKSDDPEDNGFARSVKLDLTFARNTIAPEIANKNLAQHLTLTQDSTAVNIKLGLFSWFGLKGNSTTYSYNRNLDTFVKALQTTRIVTQIRTGFSNSLASFLDRKSSLAAIFYWGDFDISFKRTFSNDATSTTTAVDSTVLVDWNLSDSWDISIGAGSTTESDTTGSDSHVSASLAYTF
jgi:hypothetical protein